MTTHAVPYRSVAPEQAIASARAEIARLRLDAQADVLGVGGGRTMRVRLFSGGVPVAVGYGKGAGTQGAASAYFEALERHLMSAPGNRRFAPGAITLVSAAEIAGQSALRTDLVVQRWAAEFPSSVAATVAHQGIAGTVRYPLFLSDPRYFQRPVPGDSVLPYHGVLRYSSSLGTAAGTDLDEAVHHGLCELIEHDGLSHALLRWFIAQIPGVDVVDRDRLPARLRALHADAVRAAAATVHLIDVTTDLDVPVYVAVSESTDTGTTRLGAGASPSGPYAAERALTELIQTCALTGAGPDDARARRLARWPALQRCVRLPVAELLSNAVRQVPLRPNPEGGNHPRAGLEQVGRLLSRHGIAYHVCEVSPADSLVAVATTIAPGLERFSLVHAGLPVVPTGRGQWMWPAAPDQPAPDTWVSSDGGMLLSDVRP